MLVKKIFPDFELENENGKLTQLVHEGWNQFNVLTSKKDRVRGGHYHKLNTEAFFIIEGKVRLLLEYNNEKEETIFSNGEMFVISPFQIHHFDFIEDTIMVSMYDKGVELENGVKDIYQE